MNACKELGNAIAATWKQVGEDPAAFPEIATEALHDSGILSTLDLLDIVEWLGTSKELPMQSASDFGQPPINVFVSPKFYIQALFWIDATTAVHEHGFDGAFGVLSGSSVHSTYKFELTNDLSKEFKLGNLIPVSSEILRKGDIRTIHAGGSFIHALFHMERPSLSVVVRTYSAGITQYSYIKPHIAFDPTHNDNAFKIKIRLLESLRFSDPKRFWQYANLLLDDASYYMLFNILAVAHQGPRGDSSQWQLLFEKSALRYGEAIVESMLRSIREEERITKLTRLRRTVHDPTHRFFLALLLNVESRDALLAFVAQQFNFRNPETLIEQWIREMADGGFILSRKEPRLVEMIALAVRCESFEKARDMMRHDAMAAWHGSEEEMEALWKAAHSVDLFQPLFKAA